ncbi:hypothetical protein [Halobacterium rubrum]|uniref:hypothetical protein n=1 Tax=Halobacterium TaxID=2239 RepID=UPI001F1D6016|nr:MULTISPECIES: hypothetical protein [Halobacterium]MDH5019780.1 hypothetical protein [Halobacterium rubrum]
MSTRQNADDTDFAEKFVELTGRETITDSGDPDETSNDRLGDETADAARETAEHTGLDDAIDAADFDDY